MSKTAEGSESLHQHRASVDEHGQLGIQWQAQLLTHLHAQSEAIGYRQPTSKGMRQGQLLQTGCQTSQEARAPSSRTTKQTRQPEQYSQHTLQPTCAGNLRACRTTKGTS